MSEPKSVSEAGAMSEPKSVSEAGAPPSAGELPIYDPARHFITVFLHRTEEGAKAFCEMLNGEKSDV